MRLTSLCVFLALALSLLLISSTGCGILLLLSLVVGCSGIFSVLLAACCNKRTAELKSTLAKVWDVSASKVGSGTTDSSNVSRDHEGRWSRCNHGGRKEREKGVDGLHSDWEYLYLIEGM
jgi:hypothetical protein